ncbi:MAG: transcriptional repressor [Prevotella sp.]|nr:transcriptional repressor [Candidatus Prevotella equi]
MESVEEHLQEHGIKPTSVRILVWREIAEVSETFTLNDVERWMPNMDRSSIFRALRLFTEHHLLHEIDDGTGHQKYCVCRCTDSQHLNHIHFTCLNCGQTYCLEDYNIPMVDLPEGFDMQEAEYIIKGVCPRCR